MVPKLIQKEDRGDPATEMSIEVGCDLDRVGDCYQHCGDLWPGVSHLEQVTCRLEGENL